MEFFRLETPGFISARIMNYELGIITVWTLIPSTSPQDLGLHAGALVQEAKHELAQLKQQLVEVWADF